MDPIYTPCSRCGGRDPNCSVCQVIPPPQTLAECYDELELDSSLEESGLTEEQRQPIPRQDYEDGLADYFRDEMKDREWDEWNEEQKKL